MNPLGPLRVRKTITHLMQFLRQGRMVQRTPKTGIVGVEENKGPSLQRLHGLKKGFNNGSEVQHQRSSRLFVPQNPVNALSVGENRFEPAKTVRFDPIVSDNDLDKPSETIEIQEHLQLGDYFDHYERDLTDRAEKICTIGAGGSGTVFLVSPCKCSSLSPLDAVA
jgi:hypothetical protein